MSELKLHDICEVLSDASGGLLPGSIVRVEARTYCGPAMCSVIFGIPGPRYDAFKRRPYRIFTRSELRVL